jgi:CHAT domain-containing protein
MNFFQKAKHLARNTKLLVRMLKGLSAARFYEKEANYEAAIYNLKEALHLAEQLRGKTSQIYLQNLLKLGFYHRRKGDAATAKQIYEELAELMRSAGESNSPEMQSVKFLIARCQGDLEEWDAAQNNLLELLDYHRNSSESNVQNLMDVVYMLATVRHGQGDYEEARRNYLQALELLQQIPNYKKEDEAWCYRELAVLAISQAAPENYAPAEKYLRQALHIFSQGDARKVDSKITVWQDLVSLYLRMGELDKAKETAQQSVDDLKFLTGENDYFLAGHLGILAKLLKKGGAYNSALSFSQQQLSILRRRCEPTDMRLAECLEKTGGFYAELHRYEEAENHFQQALSIYSANGNAGDSQRMNLEQDLITVRHQAGKTGNEKLFNRTDNDHPASFNPAGVKSPDELEKECAVYFSSGKYLEAEKIIRQILKSAQENHDEKRLAEYLIFAGRIRQEIGDTEEAERTYLDSLEFFDENLGEDRETISLIYNNLSQLYADSGRLAEADEAMQHSLKLVVDIAGENPDELVKNLNNTSALYSLIGDVSQAEDYMERALSVLREQGLQTSFLYGRILTHLSMLKLKNGEMPEAVSLITEALIIFLGQKKGREYAMSLNAFGMITLAWGDMASAERAFAESIDILENIEGFTNHPNIKLAKGNLAFVYFRQGKYEEAENQYAEVFAADEKQDTNARPLEIESLLFRALGLFALGKKDESLRYLERMVAGNERYIDNAFAFSTEKQRMQVLVRSQISFYALLILVRTVFIQDLNVVRRLLSVVLRRKALGIEALVTQREEVMSGRYPHLASALQELTALQQKIAGLLWKPPEEDSETVARKIKEAEERRAKIEANLARQIPEIRLTQKLKDVNYEKITDILPAGSVLIEFVCEQKTVENPTPDLEVFSSPHYMAFAIPAGNPDGIELFDLGSVEEINQLIQNFLGQLINIADYDELGRQLFAKAVEPWLKKFGENRQIFISPDGEFNRLPFEVLPLNAEHLFIDKYLTVYVTSGRDLIRHQMKSVSKSTEHLVVANPDFDLTAQTQKPTNSRFPAQTGSLLNPALIDFHFPLAPLQEAENEGRIVAEALGAELLVGEEALETKVKELLKKSPNVVHLATHGLFLSETDCQENNSSNLFSSENFNPGLKGAIKTEWTSENPLLRSCLALAGINAVVKGERVPVEAEDGVLTALDVSGLNLSQTELVVLSACQTGTGDIQNGEGVWGLRRAFELAGVKTLVVSLWQVDDAATAELMESFYEGLTGGLPCAEALHRAKLLLRKSNAPYYWAAFICQGNSTPVINLKKRNNIS